jgi:hypothetical protein
LIKVAELFADGLATEHEATAAYDSAFAASSELGMSVYDRTRFHQSAPDAVQAAFGVYWPSKDPDGDEGTPGVRDLMKCPDAAANAVAGAMHPGRWTDDAYAAWQAQFKVHADLFRDVLGNPFRQKVLDPAWLAWKDSTIARMAETIYDKRILPEGNLRADGLAILADALEDAGCDNTDILAHCRGPGPHVRGCWVVDLILGKQ